MNVKVNINTQKAFMTGTMNIIRQVYGLSELGKPKHQKRVRGGEHHIFSLLAGLWGTIFYWYPMF